MKLRLVNRSGYDSGDLRRFFEAGLRARARSIPSELVVVVVAAPKRSRGCAEIGLARAPRGGWRMTIAIAPPHYYGSERAFRRRLSRLFDHEIRHILGDEHEDMDEADLYSLGRESAWARGVRTPRYRGRAPKQTALIVVRRRR